MRRFLPPLLAALILHLALIQPNHPNAMTWGALRLFPLELPVLLLGLPLLGDGRAARVLRGGLAGLLTLIIGLKLADYAMFTAFGRGFNPLGDLPLAAAGFNLLSGSVGTALATLAFAALGLGVLLVAMALWWAMGQWARLPLYPPRPLWRRMGGGLAIAFAGIAAMETASIMNRWAMPFNPPGAAFTARVGAERVQLVLRTANDLREFHRLAAEDPFRGQEGLLDLIDRDVLVIFIESYGRASLEGPLYAPTSRPILEAAEDRLAARGLALRSGYLASPTRGGQSWLAHATFANGLRINDQVRYQAMLASGRQGLFHLAQTAGFNTAAIMPAITMDWPEARRMGFDLILPAASLGYRGLPFNWVTMPDQFTLAAFDRLVRTDPAREGRLFAQIALISSHAPWVPVPRLLDWDSIGDGREFNAMAQEGDPPDIVWRDRDRVRDQYRQAVGYSLEVVFSYAERLAEEAPLIIILGDHQAAGFVAQEERPDVPVHVLGPPAMVERIADWGLSPGLIPPAGQEALPMEAMRDMILNSFTSPRVSAP
ncbi:MAG: sulfatase [Cypionkella sp.]|jgi:hypothetical protein|nr:sulfatase [Cypionkella sp.]